MNRSRQQRRVRQATAVFMLCLATASAAADERVCKQWKAPALMKMTQSTLGGLEVDFQLRQTGSQLLGWAQYQTTRKTVIGNVFGDITGNGIHLRVLWTYSGDPSIGRYVGTIKPRVGGIVGDTQYGEVFEGMTYDEFRNPPEYASWNAYHFTCQLEPLPPPPPPRPTLALGRVGPRYSGPPVPICDAARSAKARNSPAAPGLERQCLASGGSMSVPLATDALSISALDRASAELPYAAAQSAPPAAAPDVSAAQIEELAATGATIAERDPEVDAARNAADDIAYARGFDVGTGLFGDPALGAVGNTATGPGSMAIRATLDASGQRGFDAAAAYHFARDYRR